MFRRIDAAEDVGRVDPAPEVAGSIAMAGPVTTACVGDDRTAVPRGSVVTTRTAPAGPVTRLPWGRT